MQISDGVLGLADFLIAYSLTAPTDFWSIDANLRYFFTLPSFGNLKANFTRRIQYKSSGMGVCRPHPLNDALGWSVGLSR